MSGAGLAKREFPLGGTTRSVLGAVSYTHLGMVRCGPGGHAIAVEVWDMPVEHVGSFLALIPQPLGLGTLELADGRRVHGFVCEPIALEGARDISHHGGWRAHLAVT